MKIISAAAVGAAAVAFGLTLAACGGNGKPAAARYASANKLVEELGEGGLHCPGASYGPPVVRGATSETGCDSGPIGLVDVFPRKITRSFVLAQATSTGTTQIWVDYGPNWFVQTDKATVRRVQAILGGTVAAGAWSPGGSSTNTSTWISSCQKLLNDLDGLGWSLTGTNLSTSPITWGQLRHLGSQMAHLSYVANTADSDPTVANDLGDASMAALNPADGVVPWSAMSNKVFDHMTSQQMPSTRQSRWLNKYLLPVLNDCASGA